MKKASIGIIPVLLYPAISALYLAIKKSDSPEVSFSCYLKITISSEHSYTQIDKDEPSDKTHLKCFTSTWLK